MYKEEPNGGVEQMITWASVHQSGSIWNGMRDLVDGKHPIKRYSESVFELNLKTLLVNRFNYPIARSAEPQEGLSRSKSTHIEPNVDWGFTVFNEVADVLYSITNTNKAVRPKPVLKYFDINANALKINIENYPLEYRISN